MKNIVMAVDDDPIFLLIAEKLIKKSNFSDNPLFFSGGRIAHEYLEVSYNSEDRFIILLDINMPDTNGWEFLEQIQIFAKPENTLVYMVTSSTNLQDIEKSKTYDTVKRFVSKPISLDFLLELKESLGI